MAFSDYVRVLRQFLWLVVVATIAGALIAFLALSIPSAKYKAEFAVALAPDTPDPGSYGNLVDALDRRSIPSTLAEVINSPIVKDAAAQASGVSRDGLAIDAIVVTDSNVVEGTVTGTNSQRTRDYAAALLAESSRKFTDLYPLYSVERLREPTDVDSVPRQIATGMLLGALAGALIAYLVALAIDANRRGHSRARLETAPFGGAKVSRPK
jgi:capsular polysaccharide biosynthesis protein